jgi:hypothetical protein
MNLQTFPCGPLDQFCQFISDYITIHIADAVTTSPSKTTFHRSPVPVIRCVLRLVQYGPCSTEVFFIALLLLKKLESLNGPGFVNHITASRTFVAAVIIASKYFDDIAYTNSTYAKIIGMSKCELFSLETEMIRRLDFSCSFTVAQFEEIAGLFQKSVRMAWKMPVTPSRTISKRMHCLLFPTRKELTFRREKEEEERGM